MSGDVAVAALPAAVADIIDRFASGSHLGYAPLLYDAGGWAAALRGDRARAQAESALAALGELAELADVHPRVRSLTRSDFLDASMVRTMRPTIKRRMRRRAGRFADIARGAAALHGALRQVLARGTLGAAPLLRPRHARRRGCWPSRSSSRARCRPLVAVVTQLESGGILRMPWRLWRRPPRLLSPRRRRPRVLPCPLGGRCAGWLPMLPARRVGVTAELRLRWLA